MDRISNLKEAEKLVEKYRSLTLDTLQWKASKMPHDRMHSVLYEYTGFGVPRTCTLCNWVGPESPPLITSVCPKCIYKVCTRDRCKTGCNKPTYDMIIYATTPKELYDAINARADHLEKIVQTAKDLIAMEIQ